MENKEVLQGLESHDTEASMSIDHNVGFGQLENQTFSLWKLLSCNLQARNLRKIPAFYILG